MPRPRSKTVAKKSTGGRPKRKQLVARKSTGGLAPHRPLVTREHARKSTGGYKNHLRYLIERRERSPSSSSSSGTSASTTESEEEEEDEANVPSSNVTASVRVNVEDQGTDTEPRTSSDSLSSASTSAANLKPSCYKDGQKIVITIPRPCLSPSFNRMGNPESVRNVNARQVKVEPAVQFVANAINALKTSRSQLSQSTSGPGGAVSTESTLDGNEMSRVISREESTEPPVADSTSETVKDSHDMAAESSTTFIPPPAIAGHSRDIDSRWMSQKAEDTVFSESGSKRSAIQSELPRKKKKHFPLDNNSTLEVPEENLPSVQHGTPRRLVSIDKIKKAFEKFQDVRRVLTNTAACSTFHSYVHLNAVEQMLINLYNDSRKRGGRLQTGDQPVILTDDPNHDGIQQPEPVQPSQTNTASQALAAETESSKPPDLAAERQSESLIHNETVQTASSQNSSSSLRGKNVAKKHASVTRSPTTLQKTTPRSNARDSIEEAIDAVVNNQSLPDYTVASTPPLTPDQELVAQLSSNVTKTLSQLLQMGFGEKTGMSFTELKTIVEQCGGRLELCLNKLTKLG